MAETTPFTARVFYKDPRVALAWLERAFGFETSMVVADNDGSVIHAEMSFNGRGRLMIGSDSDELHRHSPLTTAGVNTQWVEVQIEADIDAHCERARAAGAVISLEPRTEFYGERIYDARDPEGHIWAFNQLVQVVAYDDPVYKSIGLTVRDSL